jgi:DmsE family decaheme c-type cytochrome
MQGGMFMLKGGPFNQSPGGVSRWVRKLRALLMFVLGVLVCCAIALAAPAAGGKPSPGQAKDAAAPEFVGSETCAACHEEVAKGFASNPHTKMAQMHGNNGVTCENCHGAGKEHVEGGGDTSKIFNPAKGTTKEVNDKCLTCHQGRHSNFERSGHGEGSVSCVGCHSIHAGEDPDKLLKVSQPGLCFQCHTDIKPQFAMPYHHKVEEGLVTCSDCHNPHGTFGRKALRASVQQDAVCTKCHTETAGPFVYEHAVVKTEGCTACHFPHGGPNPRLLNRANVNTICLQCHSPSMNFTTSEPQGPTHNQNTQYQACTVCHLEIHGSNVSPVYFNTH